VKSAGSKQLGQRAQGHPDHHALEGALHDEEGALSSSLDRPGHAAIPGEAPALRLHLVGAEATVREADGDAVVADRELVPVGGVAEQRRDDDAVAAELDHLVDAVVGDLGAPRKAVQIRFPSRSPEPLSAIESAGSPPIACTRGSTSAASQGATVAREPVRLSEGNGSV
jgi:hypothetical protein